MIDLYALISPNVQKIILMLEECALPYNLIPIDVWKGEQFKAEFLKVNPNAKVPAIVDSDGPDGKPITMFESAAIFMYLADKTGKFLPKEPRARYEVIQWMMIQMTSIGPMSGQLVHFTRFAPKEISGYALSRYGTEVKRLYELVDKRLGASKFIGGPDYSIADMAIWPWFRNYELLGVKPADVPNVAKWVDTIAARPAAARTLAQVGELMKKSSRDSATPDDVDRLLGRGKYARA